MKYEQAVARTLDAAVFDLDGTLWDTSASCAVAWNRVARRHGIRFREVVAEDVRGVTGRPHDECIRNVYQGLPEAELQLLADETMEEDNLVIAERGGVIYDGVVDGLRGLSKRLPLMIVSNCQRGYIETFLAFAQVESYIKDFECWGRTGNSKSQNLADIMSRNRVRSATFVGDTAGDQKAARDNQVPFIFARYGFGEADAPEVVADSFADVVELLG